jgi:hypothetical protein
MIPKAFTLFMRCFKVLDFGFAGETSPASSIYWVSLCGKTFGEFRRPVLSYAGRDFLRLPSAGIIPPANVSFVFAPFLIDLTSFAALLS